MLQVGLIIVIFSSISFISIPFIDSNEFTTQFILVAKTNLNPINRDYFYYISKDLAELGIKVDLIVTDCGGTWPGELLAFGDFDLVTLDFTGNERTIDPDFTGIYNENGSQNFFGYHTTMDWDEALGTGKNEWYMKEGTQIMPSNSEERIQHYWEWENYLMDEILPLYPLFTPQEYVFYWSELEGFNYADGILNSWGKMNWTSSHLGQNSTEEVVIADYQWKDLNPITNGYFNTELISNAIMDPLVFFDSDKSMWPHLAETIELINDTHLRIKCRKGVKWQPDPDDLFNNEYFDANDIYFTLFCWKHVSNDQHMFDWIKEMEIVDSETIDIFIDGNPDTDENDPYAPAYARLGINILPEHYLNQTQIFDGLPDFTHPSWQKFANHCFGTGLFSIENYFEGSETILIKWEECWRLNNTITGDPALNYIERFGDYSSGLEKLRIKIVTHSEEAQAEFDEGTIDIVDFKYYPEPRNEYFDYPGYSYQTDIKYRMNFMGMNLRTIRPILGDRDPAPGDPTITKGLAVRKAIAYAINRQEINDIMHGGLYSDLHHPIYSKLGIWCNLDIIKYDYDLNEAKRYMKIAGYDVKDYTPTIGLHVEIIAILGISSLVCVLLKKRKKVEGKLRL